MLPNPVPLFLAASALVAAFNARAAERIAPPPPGRLYQGLYFDEPAAGAPSRRRLVDDEPDTGMVEERAKAGMSRPKR